MFVTNWISTTKIQKISEITNFFRHYFLSRTEVIHYIFSETICLKIVSWFYYKNQAVQSPIIDPIKKLPKYFFPKTGD